MVPSLRLFVLQQEVWEMQPPFAIEALFNDLSKTGPIVQQHHVLAKMYSLLLPPSVCHPMHQELVVFDIKVC